MALLNPNAGKKEEGKQEKKEVKVEKAENASPPIVDVEKGNGDDLPPKQEVKEVIETEDVEKATLGEDSTENFGPTPSEITNKDIEKMVKENDEKVFDEKGNPKTTCLEAVYEARLNIDKALQYTGATFGVGSEAYKSIFKGKAWLGKVLAELGTKNPYETKEPIKSAREIPATVDVFDNPNKLRLHKLRDYLQQVLHIRDLLGDCIIDVNGLVLLDVKDQDKASIAKAFSYSNLCEARFSLGFELSKIRNGNA